MTAFKCECCGGNLDVINNNGSRIIQCPYCETQQTIPQTEDEKKVNLYNRAVKLRRQCEFDKAEGIYESIVASYPDDAEAYWGLCLCKYGIEYVDDPATGKKLLPVTALLKKAFWMMRILNRCLKIPTPI